MVLVGIYYVKPELNFYLRIYFLFEMKTAIFFFVILLYCSRISFSQDNIHNDIRSFYSGKAFPENVFLTPGDSCDGTGSERHDGYTHANGIAEFTDSVRLVTLFHPVAYPWQYTKVCIGWTSIGGVSNLNYRVVMYDSLTNGYPGNLLYASPLQTASTVPAFPHMNWYSTFINLPVVNSGAAYIGIIYDNSPSTNCYLSMDINAATPEWPCFYSFDVTLPPVWHEFVNYPPYSIFRSVAVRTEGFQIQGIINQTGNVPNGYVLSQNYPNPFNPSTKIHVEIPHEGIVNLVVYDSRGSEVTRLLDNAFRRAGSFDYEFDGSNLPSGVYYYRLETGSFSVSRKMVLLK